MFLMLKIIGGKMKLKGFIPKLMILAIIITATSLPAAVNNFTYQSFNSNQFRSINDIDFFANPNPFEDFTVITVSVFTPTSGSLVIENCSGKVVKELHNGWFNGTMDFVWEGTDSDGNQLAPGFYNCKLTTGNRYTSRTIILILK